MTNYIEHELVIERQNEDGSISFIPKDEANSDYQRYLNPEAEHFTPIVTDAD
jgi:hypothetical protein